MTTIDSTTIQTRPATDQQRIERPAIRVATVEVVIPVYNEQKDLEASVRRLDAYLAETFPWRYRITIADNASTDNTWAIAERLTRELPSVRGFHLDEKGRGRALKRVWLASDADVVAYMDVDLSTDLKAFSPLVAPLLSGHSELAIGSRLAHGSHVVRGPKREFISRTYNLILKTAMRASFTDAQCGFKAIRTDVARELLPVIEDDNWFFDTEMLVVAQRIGLRIHEVPVDWVDDPNSTVHIASTATEDLKGCWRVTRGTATGRIPIRELRERLLGTGVGTSSGSNELFGQLVRFGGIVEIFGMLLRDQIRQARCELDPHIIHHNGDAAEIIFVLAHEFKLLHRHIDGEIFQHRQIQQHIGAMHFFNTFKRGRFEFLKIFQGEFVIQGHIQAVRLFSDGNHGALLKINVWF